MTLLEKAKKVKRVYGAPYTPYTRKISAQQIALVRGYLDGTVTLVQVSTALTGARHGCPNSYVTVCRVVKALYDPKSRKIQWPD